MKKTTICLTIDTETYQLIKEQTDNLSGTVNELLKSALIVKKPEVKELFDISGMVAEQKRVLESTKREVEIWKKKVEQNKHLSRITQVLE